MLITTIVCEILPRATQISLRVTGLLLPHFSICQLHRHKMLLIVHGDVSPQLEEGEGPRYGFGTEVFTYEEDHGEVAFRFWRL